MKWAVIRLFCCGCLLFWLSLPAQADSNVFPELLWVQDAAGGTLTGTDPTAMTLTLKNVRGHLTQFTNRPYRLTSLVTNEVFFLNWGMSFRSSPPNATLSYRQGSDPRPHNLALTLKDPHYDAKRKTVTYQVALMNGTPQILKGALDDYTPTLKNIPKTFGSASLFIDSVQSFPCLIDGLLYPQPDRIAFLGVVNSLTVNATTLSPDLMNLWNPTNLAFSLNGVGVINSLYFEGGVTSPLIFSFGVSQSNSVTLNQMINAGLSNTNVKIGFTIYYYDVANKAWYPAISSVTSQTTELQGRIIETASGLGLSLDPLPYPQIITPPIFPTNLAIEPLSTTPQLIAVQQSLTAKSTLYWGGNP